MTAIPQQENKIAKAVAAAGTSFMFGKLKGGFDLQKNISNYPRPYRKNEDHLRVITYFFRLYTTI